MLIIKPQVIIFNNPNERHTLLQWPAIVFTYFAATSKWEYHNLRGEFVDAKYWLKDPPLNTFFKFNESPKCGLVAIKLPITIFFNQRSLLCFEIY